MSNRALFLRHLAPTSPSPLMIEVERAEGLYFYAPDGKRYLDMISGIAVSNLGHRHPAVLAAIQAQLDRYLHVMVYGELVQSPQVRLAEALARQLPKGLSSVYLVNSGAEATEGAMKLAKRYTGRPEIIACHKAYHGSTQGALSLGGEAFRQAYRPLLPGIKHIHYGSFRDIAQEIGPQTAAVFIEPVQGEAGVVYACPAYFQALRQRCTEVGALLVFDEIQTGLGRTGRLWAFEHYGVAPDVLLLAKSLGAGLPLGAFISRPEVMQCLSQAPVLGHITTFGGHPVSCAAALAQLDEIIHTQVYAEAEEKGLYLTRQFKHPAIREIRQKGLMIALVVESFAVLKPVIDRALELGVLTDWFLYCDQAMRLAPPLNISQTELDEAAQLLNQAFQESFS
ncbi:MAG: aspartate aminotransferase family protein [Microscillaceae bacterium]|nr:aspartate aminotransferase family protein [Microscillaceae bacterium]